MEDRRPRRGRSAARGEQLARAPQGARAGARCPSDVPVVPPCGRIVRSDQHGHAPWTRLDGGDAEADWVIAPDPSIDGRRARGVASRPPDADHTTPCRSTASSRPRPTGTGSPPAASARRSAGPGRSRPTARRVPPRHRVVRPLLGGAARGVPGVGRARGRPGPAPRRLHLREGGSRGPVARPAPLGVDARRLPAPAGPDPRRSRRPGAPPAPSDGHHLGRPRPGRQRLARRGQGPRPRTTTARGPTGWRPPRTPGRSGCRRACPRRHDRDHVASVAVGDLAELLLLDTRLVGRDDRLATTVAGPRRPQPIAARRRAARWLPERLADDAGRGRWWPAASWSTSSS